MRLACNVAIGNRSLPNLAGKFIKKHVKSTLALCKHPKTNEYCIILFTAQNKNGAKYVLKGNVSQILTRFINDGKATIQFKQPPHDFYIQGDVIQLKSFLHLLKRALENKIGANEITYSSMAALPLSGKEILPKKLVIKNRSEYPSKGFPRTLESLFINDIQRCSLDKGILQLQKLKILDLHNNCIEFLPKELSNLYLTTLNLSSNNLGNAHPKYWSWIDGNLATTLTYLNLDSNNLKFLPDQIVKLQKLITLSLNNNQLKRLPGGLGNLKNLLQLLVSNNQLNIMPGSARLFHLSFIDLSNNYFESIRDIPKVIPPKTLEICSLKELSGRCVLNKHLYYSNEEIPVILVNYLDHAKYCVCGEACFEIFVRLTENLLLSNISQNFSISSDGWPVVPIDSYYCSLKCVRNVHVSRNRQPVI